MGHYFDLGCQVRFGDSAESYLYGLANSHTEAVCAVFHLNHSVALNTKRNYTGSAKQMAIADSILHKS